MRKVAIAMCLLLACSVALCSITHVIRGRGYTRAAYTGFPDLPNGENNIMFVPFTNSASPWLDVGRLGDRHLTDQATNVTHSVYTNGIQAYITLDATGSVTGNLAGVETIIVWVNSNDLWRMSTAVGTNFYNNAESAAFDTNTFYRFDGTVIAMTNAYDYSMVLGYNTAFTPDDVSNTFWQLCWANPSNFSVTSSAAIPGGHGWTRDEYEQRNALYANMRATLNYDTTFFAGGKVQANGQDTDTWNNDNGAAAATQISSLSNGWASFDGGDSISVPTTTLSFAGGGSPDQPFSLETWLNLDTAPADGQRRGVINRVGGTYEYQLGLEDDTTYLRFLLLHEDASAYVGRRTANSSIATGVWYHVVATWDGGTVNSGAAIYIDGVQADTADFSTGSYTGMTESALNTYIGVDGSGGGGFFIGDMDLTKFWDIELTPTQVTNRYNTNAVWFGKAQI